MKITVIGPGAMGGLFAANFSNTKNEVQILDKNEKRASRLNKDGIKLINLDGKEKVYKVPVEASERKIGPTDLAVICVKSYDTENVSRRLKHLMNEDTIVLSLQNGIGNIEMLGETVGSDRVIGGVTSHGATLLGTGYLRHAGVGDTVIGRWQAGRRRSGKIKIARRRLTDIARIFKDAGFETKVSDNIKELVWSKLIINVGINALTAITRLNNGRLVELENARKIMHLAVLEAVKVAKRKRISLVWSDPISKVESVARLTGKNVSSMLQDVLKKKRTEIDYINGAIVREAAGLEIQVPVNAMLTDLVKTIEAGYGKEVT